jgi:hypothetical protein
MNINRNNYEEFFLLYVDNELSAAERNTVELFVQQNADLQEELNMLQQTVMPADAVVFDKTNLLKEEFTALQENLLLYVDDELNVADTLKIENLLNTNYTANKELALLQRTKLQADTAIIFTDKKSLYRKEGGKVVGLSWRRIAAAAVVIGFGIWGTVSLVTNNKVTEGTIAKGGEVKTIVPKATQNIAAEKVQPLQQNTEAVNATTASAENPVKQALQKSITPANNKVQQIAPQQKDDVEIAVKEIKKPTNNLPKPDYNNFNNPKSNEADIATVSQMNTATEKINSGNKNPAAAQNNTNVEGYALNASFTEGEPGIDADNDSNKKTKIGGFFRKVKRLVDRTTNAEPGNGIKIAGFDIAIK